MALISRVSPLKQQPEAGLYQCLAEMQWPLVNAGPSLGRANDVQVRRPRGHKAEAESVEAEAELA
eukprot:15447561-Alexandrium_andersonii.AAC.1